MTDDCAILAEGTISSSTITLLKKHLKKNRIKDLLMKCPFCQTEISDNSKFCSACGKEMPDGSGIKKNCRQDSGVFCDNKTNSGMPSTDTKSPNNHYTFRPEKSNHGKTEEKNTDPQLNDVIRRLDSINIMQLVCLVSLFIPGVNFLGFILLLVIIFRSFDLSTRVSTTLRRFNYEKYARISDGVKTKCAVILLSVILLIIAAFVTYLGIIRLSVKLTTVGILICSVLMLVAAVLEIYCFIRLYTIMNVMNSILHNKTHPPKPKCGAVIIVPVIFTFVTFTICGIAAEIFLPVLIQYIKIEIFTIISMEANKVKLQAEICAIEFHYTNLAGNCDNTWESVEGFGWKLKSPHEYATQFVDSIEVTSVNADNSKYGYAEIKVTVNLNRKYFPGSQPKITYLGIVFNDDIKWSVYPKETTIIIPSSSAWSIWHIS